MSSCSYCRNRKGKRPCPALGGTICSLCCGEHRMSRISCPMECVYLDSGSEYPRKRLSEEFSPARRAFYQEIGDMGGQKAEALYNLNEVITFNYYEGHRDE